MVKGVVILSDIFQQIANGLGLGGGFALMALGITLVWGISGSVNFAHGNLAMVAIITTISLTRAFSENVFLALLIAIIASILIAWVSNYIYFKPFRNMVMASFVGGMAGATIIENISVATFGSFQESFPKLLPADTLQISGIYISVAAVFMLVVSGIVCVVIHYVIKKTRIGLALRGLSQDKDVASLMGINPEAVIAFAFALSGFLAGLAGILIANYFQVAEVAMGSGFTAKAFVAATLGGVGSLPGAFFGGLILGLAETLGSAYFPNGFRDVVSFSILILVLAIRPWGLFGEKG